MLVMNEFSVCHFVAVAVLSFNCADTNAQNSKSSFPTSRPVFKTLIVETALPFTLVQYTPQVAVVPGEKKGAGAEPEHTVFQMFSAMRAADYDWNFSLWSQPSQVLMRKREAASGEGKEYWEKWWRRSGGRNYSLTSKISYGKYVIINYEFAHGSQGKKSEDNIALEQIDRKWYLTQVLAADPIMMHWASPTGRVQVMPNAFP